MNISKLTLGTAQIGFNYGIANVYGKPDFNESIKILNFAWDNGINTFDTAPKYRDSEDIIGSFISTKFQTLPDNLIISTKLPPISIGEKMNFNNFYKYIKNQLVNSLNKLNIKSIPIYLLHSPKDIFLKDGLVIECLNHLKNEGFIKSFGISAYNLEEIEESLNFKEIDSIQLPINIFDHRLMTSGLLAKLVKKNYHIFARSIFLQGLFFLNPKQLPQYLKSAEEPLLKLRNLSEMANINVAELAFLFIRDLPEITSIVIGMETIEQLSENLSFLKKRPLSKNIFNSILETFKNISEDIINPSLWKK